MARLHKRVGRIIKRQTITRPDTATVMDIIGDRVDIRLGAGSNLLHYIPVVGDIDKVSIGDTVSIEWRSRDGASAPTPVVLSRADVRGTAINATQLFPDNNTIEYSSYGLRVKIGSIAQGHLNFVPALYGHVHADSLTAHGWQIDTNGTIYSQGTFIHRDGQISLGLSPDIIKLDAMHPTHRLWAGAVQPTAAPFSVTKEGAVSATAGDIGGWNIDATSLYSDSGNAKISSTEPYIKLGATAYNSGSGFWVGKDNGTYKLFIGNSAGSKITWDGSVLSITGDFQSTDFVSGATGWRIAQNGDAEFNDVRIRGTLRATVFEYNEIQATAGTLGVYRNAGIADTAFTTAGALYPGDSEFSITIRADAQSVVRYSINDWIYARTLVSGAIKTFTAIVTAVGTISSGVYTVTANQYLGDLNTTFPSGTVVVNYGPTDAGYITLSTDGGAGSSPNLSMWINKGSSSHTVLSRIGNLNGAYGYGTDTYGFGFGSYAAEKVNLVWDETNGLRFRVNATERITINNSGSLILSDTSGNAVMTFNAVGGAEITTKLTMPGASSAIAIGATPPAANNTGTGIWIDRTGFYSLLSDVYQVKIDATDGKLYAGAGDIKIGSDGITLATGTGNPNYIKWGFADILSWIGSDSVEGINYLNLTAFGGGGLGSGQVSIVAQNTSGLSTASIVLTGGSTGSVSINTGAFSVTASTVSLNTASSSAKLFINETENTKTQIGITINNNNSAEEIMSIKGSAGIAHGMTTITETDTSGFIAHDNYLTGGIKIEGLTESIVGTRLSGTATTAVTTKTTTSYAPIVLNAYKKSTTTRGDLAANENLLAIMNNATVEFVFDADGVMWASGGIFAGATYTDPGDGIIQAQAELKAPLIRATADGALNGLFIGTDVQLYRYTTNVLGTPDGIRTSSGLSIGDLALVPAAGDIIFTGGLNSYKNSTTYAGYIFVPLTTPLTSTSWDGDARATTAKTLIDLSAVFGAPAGIKAIAVRIIALDTSSAPGTGVFFGLSPNNTANSLAVNVRPAHQNLLMENSGICPCDANGDVYYQCAAFSGSSLQAHIQIWGYFI